MSMTAEAVATVAVCASAASIVWSAAYAWTRWLVRPRDSALAAPEYQEYLGRRIGDLERTVTVMTAELQQLGETQERTARLLAEHLPSGARLPRGAGDAPRVDTPH